MALLSCFYKNSLNIAVAHESKLGDIASVLTEIYIEALLVDEELADRSGRLGMLGRLMIRLPA